MTRRLISENSIEDYSRRTPTKTKSNLSPINV
jgi:hypothetical protein